MNKTDSKTTFSGEDSGGATPVPIPNTEVKPSSADGTWDASPRESRSSPGIILKEDPLRNVRGLFFSCVPGHGRMLQGIIDVCQI